MSELHAILTPSAPRRYLAAGVLFSLGAMLIWLGIFRPPSTFLWQIYLVGLGAIMLWITTKLWLATKNGIVLSEDGLTDTSGKLICAMDNIRDIERGAFSFKPSNGFLVRTKTPLPRGWAPGLWWSFGTRLGVGGVTPAQQSKFMAEALALHLAGGIKL